MNTPNLKPSPAVLLLVAVSLCLLLPDAALAQTATMETRVEGFLTKISGLLNIASVAIVTIAVIFAGYQIAFAQKRISDVAPVLIGGFLIGAAAQLAKMVIPDNPAATAHVLATVLPAYA